jgi:lipopolysaccharide heptosyltransferase III
MARVSATERAPVLRGNPTFRALDRYVGIPLVATAGALKRARPLPAEIGRIGVLNSTNIGDTVMLAPVLNDLAGAFPQAELMLFASKTTLPIARLIEGITPLEIRLSSPLAAVRTIRSQQLDVLLDFDSWPRIEPVCAVFSGARFAAGFRTAGHYRHYWYDATVDHRDGVHELENYRRLVRELGVDARSMPRLRPPGILGPDDLPPDPYVVFHLWPTGLRSGYKEWPSESWRELAAELVGRGFKIVLTGAPADAPRTHEFVEGSSGLRADMINLAGKYDLAELLDVLGGSRCVVSVNTGVMHLAAAAGAPTVGLNGPTSEKRWGPVGERVASVNSSFDGCGYLYLGWEYEGQRADCMAGISADRVLQAALELIGDN